MSSDFRVTPLPLATQASIFLIALCESAQINSLFSYAAFMVEDLIPDLPPEDIGYYAGILAAIFQASQFVTAVQWGRLSDVLGRKPALMLGVLGSCVALLMLGFARSYAMALVARGLGGALNGNIVVLKAYVSEVTDDTNRSKGFSLLPLSWGAGSVIGPLLGGLLSRPAKFAPGVRFFEDWPYALPNLGMLCLQLVAAVTILRLRETRVGSAACLRRRRHRARDAAGDGVQLVPARAVARAAAGAEERAEEADGKLEPLADENASAEAAWSRVDAAGASKPASPAAPSPAAESAGTRGRADSEEAAAEGATPMFRLMCEPMVLLTTAAYGVLAFAFIVFDEAFPLLLKAPAERNGLGFSTTQIGIALAIGGLSAVAGTVTFVPRAVHALGPVRAFKTGLVLSIAVFLAAPLVPYTRPAPVAMWAVLGLALSLKLIVGCFTFIASMVVINNSVRKPDLGVANGIGQSWGSVARTIGPAAGGALFSYATKQRFLLHQGLVCFACAGVCTIALALTTRMPASLNVQRGADPAKPGAASTEDVVMDV